MCGDANSRYQNIFLCAAAAAYARECRLANVTIDWMSNTRLQTICQDAQYGQCTGGAAYSDCSPKCSQTCTQLANVNQTCYERDCIAGCSCPSQSFLDGSTNGKPQCVPINKCSCYDSESNTYASAGTVLTRSCGNWYAFSLKIIDSSYFLFIRRSFFIVHSTCENAVWKCGSAVCNDIVICPANQVYANNASSCPKTCDNMNSWQDCGATYEGCSCPPGQVLSQDVSIFDEYGNEKTLYFYSFS